MTDQEAIKWIDGRVLELACYVDIASNDRQMKRINEEYNALLKARAAIEKHILMAPDRTIIHNDEIWKKAVFRCPRCTETLLIVEAIVHPVCGFEKVEHGARSTFCPACGQALKW